MVVALDYTLTSGVKETKRLDNQLKAPVVHHITSSMAGIVTIRGFSKEYVFKERYQHPHYEYQHLLNPLSYQV